LLAEKYLGKPLKEIELSAMLRDLVQGALKFGIEIPPEFMMVGKALMTLEGIGKQLDPDLDIYGQSQPYFIEIMKKRYSPEKLGNDLWRGVEQLSKVGYDMPLQLREVLDDLRLGRLTMKTDVTAPLPVIDQAGKRVFAGLTFASLLGAGAYLLGQKMQIPAIVFFILAGLTWLGDLARRK
jgi:ubiquinone biosynthesis protein